MYPFALHNLKWFFPLLLIVLAACSDQNESPIPTATAQSPIATATHTPTPSPTPIPDVLTTLPESFADEDISVASEEYVMQITRMYSRQSIGSSTADPQKQYLIVEAYIYNYSGSDLVIFNSDFTVDFVSLDTEENEPQTPDVNLMRLFKDETSTDRNWPAQNWRPDRKLTIPAKQALPIFLIYHTPANISLMNLHFTPAGGSLTNSLGLWLTQTNGNEYQITKVSYGDEIIEKWEFLPETVSELTQVIDTRVESLDNCFGTSVMERETGLNRTIRREVTTSISNRRLGTVLRVFPPFRLLSSVLSGVIAFRHQRMEGEEMSFSDITRLAAAPGTHTEYEVTYYMVTIQGVVRMTLGDEVFDIPYSIGDRLRTDVKSLDPISCPTAEP